MASIPPAFEQIDLQIADLTRDIENQRQRVAGLKADGGDVAEAEKVLAEVERGLEELQKHRDLLFSKMVE